MATFKFQMLLSIMVNNFLHKSKIDRLLKTRSNLEDTRKNEEKVLFFLKNKIKSILDVGCGTGFIFEWIKKNYTECNYLGVDIDKIAIKYAKKKYNDRIFKCSSFFSIKKKFDLILLFELFYQFKNYKKVISKLYQLSDNYISFDARVKFSGSTILDKELSYFYYHDTGKTNHYVVHNIYEFLNFLSTPKFNFDKIYLNLYKPKKITSAYLPFKKSDMLIGVFILKKGKKNIREGKKLRNKKNQFENLIVWPKKYEKFFK